MSHSAEALQAFYLLAPSTILLLTGAAPIRDHLIAYGPRTTSVPHSRGKTSLVAWVAALRVPHGAFMHFYVVSVLSTLFWMSQYLLGGSLLRSICTWGPQHVDERMSMTTIELIWALMTLQGLRRLFETSRPGKPSSSTMWAGHWLIGILFYLATNVAIWIEGAGTLNDATPGFSSLTYSAPSIKTIILLPFFILASGIQHDCHNYLASLKKYTLPVHPIFNLLICPHYTAECVIYVVFMFIAAPEGKWINRTMLTTFIFVFTNLAVTARGTRQWYEGKFGKDAVKDRWTMIPFIW